MTADELMVKADQALLSAQLLIEAQDAHGAWDRAYYAMFDAARAALLVLGIDRGRTHKGVLNQFSAQFVKTGALAVDLGRALKRAETFRYVADYQGDAVDLDDARTLVADAEIFVAGVRAYRADEK